MAMKLICDVTGTEKDVRVVGPDKSVEQDVIVNNKKVRVSTTLYWEDGIEHVSNAAVATAMRAAAKEVSKAGAGQGGPGKERKKGAAEPPDLPLGGEEEEEEGEDE